MLVGLAFHVLKIGGEVLTTLMGGKDNVLKMVELLKILFQILFGFVRF